MKKIEVLKAFKQILLEYQKIQLLNVLSNEVENMLPTIGKPKQKVLTLLK